MKKLKTMRRILQAGATTIVNLEQTYKEEKYNFVRYKDILAH